MAVGLFRDAILAEQVVQASSAGAETKVGCGAWFW